MWILITKLAPAYYRKLDTLMGNIGRYRDLSSWRKAFKSDWKNCAKKDIPMPMNDRYRPDVKQWVCTCPSQYQSRFLICKHLVQGVKPVPATFFLEVTRNRTLPIWSHPTLVPVDSDGQQTEVIGEQESEDDNQPDLDVDGDENDDRQEEEYRVTAEALHSVSSTYEERMRSLIRDLRSFTDGLEYQMQFRDERMLDSIARNGGGFLRMMDGCLEKERRQNTIRGPNIGTWDSGAASSMFYRTRPRRGEERT